MAESAPIYDPDNKEPVTRPQLRALEGSGETSPSSGNLSAAPDPSDLSSKEEETTPPAQHENQVGRGYTGESSDSQGFRARLKARRKLLLGLGAGGAVTLLIVGGLFGFLNVFKLDHIMSNIDARTFARLNGVADRRSVRWMQAYMEIRLMDIGDHPDLNNGKNSDNLMFRAEKVRTGNPIADWYRTLRSSRFEADLLEKRGIKFTSVSVQKEGRVVIRPGKISINNIDVLNYDKLSQADLTKIASGDIGTLNKLQLSDDILKVFDTDKEARRAMRQAVNDETHFFQVYKRRHVRKAIQNKTGVRDWRFFENTRNKLDEKKIQIRNKILDKAIPSNLKSGQILRCLFGIDECRYSRDAADPVNKDSEIANNGNGQQRTKDDGTSLDEYQTTVDDNGKPLGVDKNNNPISRTVKADPTRISQDAADLAAKIGTKLGSSLNALTATVNITGTLEMLSHIDSGIKNLGKMAIIAKGVQAMGLFQVFETSRDQIKSGEVNGAEVNQFMQVIGTVTASEGYAKVIGGQGDASKLTNTQASQDYCSDKSQATMQKDPSLGGKKTKEGDFSIAYLCPDKQVGGGSNAQSIQDKYNASIGQVIHPIAGLYTGAKNIPLLGNVIKAANSVLNLVGDVVGKAVLGLVKSVGLGDDLKSVMSYVMGKLASFLGAGPIMSGTEWAGEFMNWLVQGGAYTAESTARAEGASLTTPESKATAITTLHAYQQDEQAQMTAFDRLLSTSNPDSLASKSLFGIAQLKFSSVGNLFADFGQSLKSASLAIFSGFNHKVAAAGIDGYAGANFAGIETYDFPDCNQLVNPITANPLDGTNALGIFRENGINQNDDNKQYFDKLAAWDTETNSDDFYATIYQIITGSGHKDDADDIATQIYNCNLLDTAIRGSLGNLYGYTKDNGLEETNATSTVSPSGSSPTQIPPELWDIFTVAAAKYNISPYALAAIYGYGEYCTPEGACSSSQIDWDTTLIQTTTSSAGAKGPFQFIDSTWNGYQEDCDGDSKKDIYNLKDTACGAARYLAESGAKGIFDAASGEHEAGLKKSFLAYNHAQWYANRVYEGYKVLLAAGAPNSNTAQVSGTIQQLAQQILDSPNITYPYDPPNGGSAYTKKVLEALAKGEKAPVTCANAGVTSTDINANILKMILELGSQAKVGVNALTDKCHMNGSPHYKGLAADFECGTVPFSTAMADPIAAKYGGSRNFETCEIHHHWHYDFTSN